MYSLLLSLSMMSSSAKENMREELDQFKYRLNIPAWQIQFIYRNAYEDHYAYESLIKEYKMYGFPVPQWAKDELEEVNRILSGWSSLDSAYATRYKGYTDQYRFYCLTRAKEYFKPELDAGKPLPMPIMPVMWESYSYLSITTAVQHSLLPQ